MRSRNLKDKFTLFNLQSFDASIGKVASSVAAETGATIDFVDTIKPSPIGFSLDSTKFLHFFPDFHFQGNLRVVLSNLVHHVPMSITPKGPHQEKPLRIGRNSVPCPVCGSHDLQEVLDLHDQPLANDFKRTRLESLNTTRYPLKLVRCRVCNHLHLSHVTDRPNLFSDYLYQSGTSKTLFKYFEWLADKIIKETRKAKGTILEIACNYVTQLDVFSAKGWKTYGVDPAANIVPIARKKGHNCYRWILGIDCLERSPTADRLGRHCCAKCVSSRGESR